MRVLVSWSTRLVLAALACCGSPALCVEEPSKPEVPSDVLFYCSFDGTVDPEVQRGEKGHKEATPLEFIKGHKGKALVTSHTRHAVYPLKGNLNVKEGTIKFWVMPLDWGAGDGCFHHFVTVPEQIPADDKYARVFSVVLYKFLEWDSVLAYGMAGELTGDFILKRPMGNDWTPKKWHQIVWTWDREGAELYVDGTGTRRKYLQAAPETMIAESFTVGGPYFIENKTLTALDELYIFSRRLTGQEILQLYRTELLESVMQR